MSEQSPSKETKRKFDSERNLLEECEYVNGIKHGKWISYHLNGTKKHEAEYRDGKLHGHLRNWDEDGGKILDANLKDGDYDGPYMSWWDNGNKKEEGFYTKGCKIGKYSWYKMDGSIWQESDIQEQPQNDSP